MQHRAHPLRRLGTAAVIAAAASMLGACQELRLPSVYRIDIQQGNVINQEQLAALESGMEKRKVRFILGTPLVADAFNPDRWDYYYSLERRGEDRVQRVISVYFEDERLVRVGGDVEPAVGPIVVAARKDELVTVPEGYIDEGILAALTPGMFSKRQKFEPPAEQAPAAAAAVDAQAPAAAATVLEVSADDARYLRDLLAGFGSPAATATAAAPETAAPEAQASDEEEGIFSRWARRLGIGDDAPREAGAAPQSPPPVE